MYTQQQNQHSENKLYDLEDLGLLVWWLEQKTTYFSNAGAMVISHRIRNTSPTKQRRVKGTTPSFNH